MKRIAYLEPVNGLNAYGRELLPHLARHYDVDVFTDARQDALAPDVRQGFAPRCFEDFQRRDGYAHLVFQLRNNKDHIPVYDLLIDGGGVSVFHDANISGIIGGKTLGQGRKWGFMRELARAEGLRAFLLTGLRLLFQKRWPGPCEYRMNRVALKNSRGVIVHNEQARRALEEGRADVPMTVIRRGVPEIDAVDPIAARRRLRLSSTTFLVVSLGYVTKRKRIPQALAAFAKLRARVPDAHYVLVGKPAAEFDGSELIQRLGLANSVEVTGWVAEDVFHEYLSASDVCVHLRYPVEGETSSVALRSMSYAKPTLVSDAGSMREWPDDVCVKIKPDDGEVEAIFQTLYRLSQHPEARYSLGERARSYTRCHHTWQAAAQAYHDFLERLAD